MADAFVALRVCLLRYIVCLLYFNHSKRANHHCHVTHTHKGANHRNGSFVCWNNLAMYVMHGEYRNLGFGTCNYARMCVCMYVEMFRWTAKIDRQHIFSHTKAIDKIDRQHIFSHTKAIDKIDRQHIFVIQRR